MKFCKNLQRVVDISDPEWAPYWTNYKMLKKLIKGLPSLVPSEEGGRKQSVESDIPSDEAADPLHLDSLDSRKVTQQYADAASQHVGDKTAEVKVDVDSAAMEDPGGGDSDDKVHQIEELGKNPGEIAFFKLLHSEFKKASHFFEKAQLEFSIREDRVREGMEIMKRPNSIMVNEKWSMLAKSIYKLYKDLLLLETFAIMTYCSFSKILKKHDKVTGHDTRTAFMENVVNKSNFATYPKVLAMINRCEQMYEEVSARLLQEGKEGLYEDERLFINMISRLNEQTLDHVDAPELQSSRRPKSLTAAIISQSLHRESAQMSALRSMVEENDARLVTQGYVESDQSTTETRKRNASADTKPAATETKRPKQSD